MGGGSNRPPPPKHSGFYQGDAGWDANPASMQPQSGPVSQWQLEYGGQSPERYLPRPAPLRAPAQSVPSRYQQHAADSGQIVGLDGLYNLGSYAQNAVKSAPETSAPAPFPEDLTRFGITPEMYQSTHDQASYSTGALSDLFLENPVVSKRLAELNQPSPTAMGKGVRSRRQEVKFPTLTRRRYQSGGLLEMGLGAAGGLPAGPPGMPPMGPSGMGPVEESVDFAMQETPTGFEEELSVQENIPGFVGDESATVVMEAQEALAGQHPNPEEAIRAFVLMFGEEALQELMALMGTQGSQAMAMPEMPEAMTMPEMPQAMTMPEMPGAMAMPLGPGGMPTPQGFAEGGLMVRDPRLIRGRGDGMSDSIPATIDGQEPIAVSSGEMVISADDVSNIGNGDTNAGSETITAFLEDIRRKRNGSGTRPKQVDVRRMFLG